MNLEELRLLLAEAIRGSEFAGRVYFAGGCVRDQLLAREAAKLDADIAVELPQGGVRLARFLQGILPTGEPVVPRGFGTATSHLGEVQLDFVMTRSEKYPPGSRHPRVRFASLDEDCRRRDFTVNALYQEIMAGRILDPCGRGLADLEQKTIRCVGDPGESFVEDPLRMLRALRFAVVLGFEIEASTWKALKANAHLVSSLSRRRCRNELGRLEACLDAAKRQRCGKLLRDSGTGQYLQKRLPE